MPLALDLNVVGFDNVLERRFDGSGNTLEISISTSVETLGYECIMSL